MAGNEAMKAMAATLASLQGDEALTDFTIVCGDRKWNVHRVVLTLHSPVLTKAITGAFKESGDRQIDLSEHLPDSVDALISYAYQLDYLVPNRDGSDGDDLDRLSFHVSVCILADKYEIAPLKNIAIKKFEATIDEAVEHLPTAAELAYDASPATEQIRKKIVLFGIEQKLLSTAGKTGLAAVMVNMPELARDYAQALESRLTDQQAEANRLTDELAKAGEACQVTLRCPAWSCGATLMGTISILRTNVMKRCDYCGQNNEARRWL